MGSSSGKPEFDLSVNDKCVRPWTAVYTDELAESLMACPSMDDLDFHSLFLRHVGASLEMDRPFPVKNYSDPRDHVYAIVYACEDYKDPAKAVAALTDSMRKLRGDSGALARLEDCDAAIRGLSVLSTDQLVSVLKVISSLSPERDDAAVHLVAYQAKFDGEILPLRGTEDLPGIVRRLNGARVTVGVKVPLIVRFLARLASSMTGDDRSRLVAEVNRIADELKLSQGDIRASSPDSAHCASDKRILQIRVADISSPESQRYTIDAAVFSVSSSWRQRITSWPCDTECSRQDIDDAGRWFLERAKGLGRAVGAQDTVVEFLLPWSLLGHPVERWGLDEDHWIGLRFPVVVRSLDRQQKELYYKPWLKRWDMLVGHDSARSVGERIGWLHYGNAVAPEHADNTGRIIHLTGRHDLTPWLARPENCATAGLGLTFPYSPEDPICLKAIKDAVREGIPLLVWCRENADVNQLEHLLERVKIDDLRDEIHAWRCLTADDDNTTRDARRHIVLLLDDPSDVGRPSEHLFAAPQYV